MIVATLAARGEFIQLERVGLCVSQTRGYRFAVSASRNWRGVSAFSSVVRIASSFTSRTSVPTQIR